MQKTRSGLLLLTRSQLFLLGLLFLSIAASAAFTQPGGGGRGGGMGRGGFDPDKMFDMYSGGKDTFDVSAYKHPEWMSRIPNAPTEEKTKEAMSAFLQRKGVTSGVFNRDLFKGYNEEQQADRAFQMYAGKDAKGDSFDVNKMEVPFFLKMGGESADSIKQKMNDFLKTKGVTNGQMTKTLLAEYSAGQRSSREKQREEREKESQTPEGKAKQAAREEQAVKGRFEAFDSDKNGFLDAEELKRVKEMGGTLPDRMAEFDKNKDGKIDLAEYAEYSKIREIERTKEREDRKAGKDGKVDDKGKEAEKVPTIDETRPTVYRLGKMPKDIPSWFESIDKDKDGQVGMYEWRQDSKSDEDFVKMDANQDGFVTVEEILRHQKGESVKKDALLAGTYASLTGPQPASIALVTAGGVGGMGGRGDGKTAGRGQGGRGGIFGGMMGKGKGGKGGKGGGGESTPPGSAGATEGKGGKSGPTEGKAGKSGKGGRTRGN